MIESRYWRDDITRYAKSFHTKKRPPQFSERLVVNFEKDVIIALFMVRTLAEAGKFSTKFKNYRARLFRCSFKGNPRKLIYQDIEELYELEKEQNITKDAFFVCNQFIHAIFTYAIRGDDRNWTGLYTCSDREKKKFIYRIPLSEIINILELAAEDGPTTMQWSYNKEKDDWEIITD